MKSIDLIGCYVIACFCTVFVGAQSLNHLTSNTDFQTLLRRFKRQAAAFGAAAPAATGGMHHMWMDPPDGLPLYMMSSYMRGGGMGMGYPRMRYHDGIPGRLADGSDLAQQTYRNTAAMRAMNAIQGGPPPPQPPPTPPPPPPGPGMFPRRRFPAPPPPPRAPRRRTGNRRAQGLYFMAPDLIRAGLPAMLSPAKARIVRPMINQMRAMGRTADQISDQIGDVLMV